MYNLGVPLAPCRETGRAKYLHNLPRHSQLVIDTHCQERLERIQPLSLNEKSVNPVHVVTYWDSATRLYCESAREDILKKYDSPSKNGKTATPSHTIIS